MQLGVGLGTVLLLIRNGMNNGCYEVSDNATLHPIGFSSKNLSSTKWYYSNIEQEVHCIQTWSRAVQSRLSYPGTTI